MISGTVSGLSMLCMGVSAVVSFLIPVLLYLFFRRRFGASGKAFWVGCGVFVVFALMLESAMHRLVLNSGVGETIQNHIWLYALYGGLAAGVFEETGRFLAMRHVLKQEQPIDGNALMYGAGHGGAEAALLLGLTMVSNLVVSVMINSGAAEKLLSSVPAEALSQAQAQFTALIETRPADFLLGILERLLAVTLHISLSVLVWFAATRKRSAWLFPLAILLHALVDGVTVVCAQHLSGLAVEGVIALLTLGVLLVACGVWKRYVRT